MFAAISYKVGSKKPRDAPTSKTLGGNISRVTPRNHVYAPLFHKTSQQKIEKLRVLCNYLYVGGDFGKYIGSGKPLTAPTAQA